MTHRTFDDLRVGETIDCGTNAVTEAEITDFGAAFDPLPIHVDPEAAADSPFGGLIASGIHTFALTQPPVVEHFYRDSDLVAASHVEDLELPNPVRPGDTLHVELEILDTEVAENGRGIVTTRRTATVGDDLVFDLRNQTVWDR
jgi:acyl dehydratase